DPESKKMAKMQGEEQGHICRDGSFTIVKCDKNIFHKMKQVGIFFGLLQTFCQQLYDEHGHCIFMNVGKDMIVNDPPFEFPDPVQLFQLVMINDHVKDPAGLK